MTTTAINNTIRSRSARGRAAGTTNAEDMNDRVWRTYTSIDVDQERGRGGRAEAAARGINMAAEARPEERGGS